MGFVSRIVDTLGLSGVGDTLAHPLQAKPSDMFKAFGLPVEGGLTHEINTNPALAPAAAGIAGYYTGGLSTPFVGKSIQLENQDRPDMSGIDMNLVNAAGIAGGVYGNLSGGTNWAKSAPPSTGATTSPVTQSTVDGTTFAPGVPNTGVTADPFAGMSADQAVNVAAGATPMPSAANPFAGMSADQAVNVAAGGTGTTPMTFWDGMQKAAPALGALGSLYSGSTTAQAVDQANAALQAGGKQAQNTIQQYAGPYAQAGQQALTQYTAGIQPGGQFNSAFSMADAQNTPAMQEALRQGSAAVQGSAAARGGLLGTNTLAGLQNMGQATGAQYENLAFNQWLQNRNANQSAISGLANIGGQAAIGMGNSLSGIQQSMANAQAGSTLGQNAARTGGQQNALSSLASGVKDAGSIVGGFKDLFSLFA